MHTLATQWPVDSTMALAYEHIVTKNTNITDIIYLNVVGKSIAWTTEKHAYNFVW